MVHQPSGGIRGQATDMLIHVEEILKLKSLINQIYKKHTGQTIEKIEAQLERDTFLNAEEAKKFGLIDNIMSTRESDKNDGLKDK